MDSTNDVAAALAAQGAAEGTVVVAEEQRRGRGRQGRAWIAPRGACLSCSVVLRPRRERREWPDLSWVLAGAVASLAADADAGAVAIKYPNDVYTGGRKLAGLLLETRTGPGAPEALIAGIGVNVNLRAEAFPGELAGRATSLLAATGRELPVGEVLARLCPLLDRWYRLWSGEGAAAVRGLLAREGIGIWGAGEERGALLESAGEGEG